jgi:tripartite-type tricarboxylate transporter receptor subunit TctC
MTSRRALLAGAGTLAVPAALHGQAAWPGDKPVEVIVPFPAGGGVDVMTRLVMPLVAAQIPGFRPVVVNRTGAAGQIGLEAIFNAAADGYAIGATTIPAHNAIPLERQVRYRAMDFTFLCNIVEDANCFTVRAESPFRAVADVVAAARARPSHVTYGTTGIGSDDHLFMLAFEAAANVPPMVQVPFAGAAPLIPQLLGGNMDLAVLNVNDAPQRRAHLPRGRLRHRRRRLPRDRRPAWHAGADRRAARSRVPRRAGRRGLPPRGRAPEHAAAAAGRCRIQGLCAVDRRPVEAVVAGAPLAGLT